MSQKKKKKAKSFIFWAKSQEMSLEEGLLHWPPTDSR